jgi:hypothetical protein
MARQVLPKYVGIRCLTLPSVCPMINLYSGLPMKKFILIVISLFAICLVVTFFPRSLLPQPHWRVTGDRYRRMLGRDSLSFRYTAHDKASQPQNFTSAMSAKTYSDTLDFQVYENFVGERVTGISPLPYPPVEVYCVKGQYEMVNSIFFFVALHSDGVHSAWVVHTPPGVWNTHKIFTDKIGCPR